MKSSVSHLAFAVIASLALGAGVASAQTQQPTGSAVQREALAKLAFLDGEWRGTAVTSGPGGAVTLTQTERVGPMLGGSIRVIEGRGYAADGSTQFNAMATIAWDPRTSRYNFHAYANGHFGDYPFEVTEDGFKWETPAGPNAKVLYVATIKDGEWHEVGDYVAEGQPPRRFIELRLRRIGDTAWPGGDPVSPTP